MSEGDAKNDVLFINVKILRDYMNEKVVELRKTE